MEEQYDAAEWLSEELERDARRYPVFGGESAEAGL